MFCPKIVHKQALKQIDKGTYLDFQPESILELVDNDFLKFEKEDEEDMMRIHCRKHDHVLSLLHPNKFETGMLTKNAKQEYQP